MYYSQPQRSASRQSNLVRKVIPLSLRYLVCGVVAFFVLVPIIIAILGGFKTTGELVSSPFSLPSVWHWGNYTTILSQSSFWQTVTNSLITTLTTVGVLLALACPAAFIFARLHFRGRDTIFTIMLLGLLFPITMAILPLYITLRSLGLVDNLAGLILPQVAFGLPMTILILRNFFQAIPQELEDATYIDGGSPMTFFWRILIPLARPSLAVVSMLTMVSSWNNFLLPLLVLNNNNLWTIPLGIMQFQGQYSVEWALVMAYISLTIIPAIIFYLFAERYLIAGLTTGAVKG